MSERPVNEIFGVEFNSPVGGWMLMMHMFPLWTREQAQGAIRYRLLEFPVGKRAKAEKAYRVVRWARDFT